jgi:phage anti-repressor protein
MGTSVKNPETLQQMLKDVFTSEDEKTFLSHFNMYLEHGNDSTKHVVDFDHVWEWMGFSRKDSAKRTLQKFFVVDTEFSIEILLRPNVEQSQSHRGGHNKEKIMLSVNTFKTLCMLSNTDKGKRTRAYYVRMEEALIEFMKDELRRDYASLESQIRRDNEITHHKTLITQNHKKQCVYIFRVSDISENGEYLVRFGKTCDIKTRAREHAQNFDICVLLDVITTPEEHKLEQHILHRPVLLRRRVNRTEMIRLDSEFTLEQFTKMIRHSAQMIEEARLDTSQLLTKRILDLNVDDTIKADILKQVALPSAIPEPHIETPRFRRVYQYAPDNLATPIATFHSLREAARSTNDPKIRDYHIRDASSANIVVAEHRWYYVDESEENPSMLPPPSIPETWTPPEVKKTSSLIAQISSDKMRVIKVHANINAAAADVQTSACNITVAKQRNKKAKGFYWTMWDDVSQELKDTYTAPLPAPLKSKTCSKRIEQKDPVTLEVIQEFPCFQDVVNKFRICHKKLNQLCDSGAIYKGFVWSLVQ